MKPRDAGDALFSRDVQQILRAAEVGQRWADNIGPVVTFRYLAARAPFDVETKTPGGVAPHAVLVLRAVNRDDATIESGCRVAWKWGRGRVVVSAIDVTDTADEYDVTLGILLG